ncbi:hypothetical protein [Arthrobacter sp. AL12]|uniref:hypothetical protein n=1 Tax=Arthrobacter sp. AL12 TaxID=3042241 RepID=UPI00249ABE67|nr:hypothetical protein [Arthrobacter sp. AL12]MDI3213591.1 hypothetical protein [Arthrobacter sp. AL12]
MAVKRPGVDWGHTTAQTVLSDDDQTIVKGRKAKAERFSTLPEPVTAPREDSYQDRAEGPHRAGLSG